MSDDSKETETGNDPEPRRKRSFAKELPFLIFGALLIALLIKTFLVQAFWIPSGSMLPTLQLGDRVLVNRLSYHPHQGDIIVFKNPQLPPEQPRSGLAAVGHWAQQLVGFSLPKDEYLIKRVIGLPGDTVKVTPEVTLVNGKAIDEPYVNTGGQGTTGTWTVPNDAVFVMGDNRSASEDSRFIGSIPLDTIVGRAFLRMWPPSRAGGL